MARRCKWCVLFLKMEIWMETKWTEWGETGRLWVSNVHQRHWMGGKRWHVHWDLAASDNPLLSCTSRMLCSHNSAKDFSGIDSISEHVQILLLPFQPMGLFCLHTQKNPAYTSCFEPACLSAFFLLPNLSTTLIQVFATSDSGSDVAFALFAVDLAVCSLTFQF